MKMKTSVIFETKYLENIVKLEIIVIIQENIELLHIAYIIMGLTMIIILS